MPNENKLLTAGNLPLAVTNLYSNPGPNYTMDGVPLGTVDGTGTGEIGAKVITLNGATAATPQFTVQTGATTFFVNRGTGNAGGTVTVAARAGRRTIAISCNIDSPEPIYYGPTTGVTTANGARLNPGQSQSLDTIGAIFVCASAGAGTFTAVEV